MGVQAGPGAAEGRATRAPDWWFRGALALALVPFGVSAVTLATSARGYGSFGDVALTELTIRSVGRTFPEVGVYSTHGWFHPGPALFYVLVLPYRVFGSRSVSLLLAALLVNAICVVAIGVIARRRAGTGFAVLMLAGTALLAHGLGAAIIRSPWNPYLLVLPFVLFVLLSWSLMEGDVAMLPWLAGVATFVVQSHVATLEPVLAIVATASIAFAVQHHSARDQPRPRLTRPVVWTAAVLVVLWLPPVIDAVAHNGGNLRALYDYFTGHNTRTTVVAGLKTVSAQLTVHPPWVVGDPFPIVPFTNRYHVPRHPVPWLGLALLVGTVVAWRRREHAAARLGLLVSVGLAAAVVAFSRVPTGLGFWFVSWMPALGMLAGVATVWAFWRVFVTRSAPVAPRLRWATLAAGTLVLAVPAVLLSVSSADANRVPDGLQARAVSQVSGPTLAALRRVRGPVLVRIRGVTLADPAFVLLIDEHGGHGVVKGGDERTYPPTNRLHRKPPAAVLTVVPWTMTTYVPAPGERRIAGPVDHAPATLAAARTAAERLAYARSLLRIAFVTYVGPPAS